MPNFKTKLLGIKLDGKMWSKEFQRDMERLTRNGAREFIRAVITRVPQWSGQAMGSIKFARGNDGIFSRFLEQEVPVNPINGPGNFKSPTSGKTVHIDRRKTPESGGKYGRFNFRYTGHVFSFSFKSEVPHYLFNEFFERTDPGKDGQQIQAPWGSLLAGRKAYRSYIRQEIKAKRFARITKYISRVELSSQYVPNDDYPEFNSTVTDNG